MVYSCNGKLLSSKKKEQTTDTHNIGEPKGICIYHSGEEYTVSFHLRAVEDQATRIQGDKSESGCLLVED